MYCITSITKQTVCEGLFCQIDLSRIQAQRSSYELFQTFKSPGRNELRTKKFQSHFKDQQMKNLSLWSVLLITTIISSSCNDDSYNSEVSTEENTSYQMRQADDPSNSANTYDIAGQLHIELTEGYLLSNPKPITLGTTIAAVELIANLNPTFLSMRPYDYVSPTASRMEHILTNGNKAINNLAISASAKSSLAHFIDTLMIYQDNSTDFADVYSYIINYEASVMLNNSYNEMDKRILLTTSSIARHAMHFARKRKKPRDRDWDISWGSIVAGGSGTEESMSKAVVMSAVAGIDLNIKN